MKKINGKTLFNYYSKMFQKHFPTINPPSFSVKDTALLKKLIDEQGEQKSYDYITDVIDQWSSIKKQVKGLKGYPTVGVLWGFRFTFIDLLENKQVNHSVSYEKTENKSKRSGRTNTKKLFLQN